MNNFDSGRMKTEDLRFMKLYENEYGICYQSTKKVFINGVIDSELGYNNNVHIEIDFNTRCGIWQFERYFRKRLELERNNVDYDRVEFKTFINNWWDDYACFIWMKMTDQNKWYGKSGQRKDHISYKHCRRGDLFSEMCYIIYFVPNGIIESMKEDKYNPKKISVSFQF